jgi:hypothetical protein
MDPFYYGPRSPLCVMLVIQGSDHVVVIVAIGICDSVIVIHFLSL